ncbi:hypothetical protein Ccar_21200 [Clostridium carboxidivorans P7]|nr:hypothetical protein Ccar_21200 [Clostridium carboxidivorans P7]
MLKDQEVPKVQVVVLNPEASLPLNLLVVLEVLRHLSLHREALNPQMGILNPEIFQIHLSPLRETLIHKHQTVVQIVEHLEVTIVEVDDHFYLFQYLYQSLGDMDIVPVMVTAPEAF